MEIFSWPEPWLWTGSLGLGQALLYTLGSQDLAHLPECSVPLSSHSSRGAASRIKSPARFLLAHTARLTFQRTTYCVPSS